MIEGLEGEEQVRAMQQVLGVDEVTARFIIAIETGEIAGDVIELDENGNEIKPKEEAGDAIQ